MKWSFLLFFALVISACSPKDGATSKREKLVIWTSNEHIKKAIDTVGKKFVEDYQVDLETVVLNKDLTTQFKTAAISGKGPDVFTWAHDVVGELAASGLIEPVHISKTLEESLFSVALDAFRFKGKTYGYPYDLEAIALIYNKKLLPVPPETMEELIQFSKRLKKMKSENYGFLYDIGNFFFSFPFLSARGGYIFKVEDGVSKVNDIGLNNNGSVLGGDLIARLVKEDVVPESTDYSVAFNLMKKGQLAANINGPWSMSDLIKSRIDFGVAPLPKYKGSRPRPFVGVHGFIIRRSSQKKELAKELVENYLMTKEGIMSLYKLDPRGPSRKDVAAELKDDKYLQAFLESAASGIPMPNVPQMGAVWGAMGTALRFIITGKKSSQEALDVAVEQVKASIEKK